VLVSAPRHRAAVTEYLDPAERELQMELSRMPQVIPPDRLLRGRVVDEHGRPVSSALVTPCGAKTSEKRWFGSLPGVDDAAATDDEGRFVISSRDPKLGLDVEVAARGFAIHPAELLALNGEEHVISLLRGATVHGRLLWDGRPAPGREIGIVQRDRSVGPFVGEVTLATDDDGRFLFPNLQPEQQYVLYTLCPGADKPVLKVKSIETGPSDTTQDVGDLTLIEGLTLAGRVVLPEGAEMPPDARIRISRDPAWDWCELPLKSDGSFAIHGLPPEVFTFHVTAPGYKIDASRLRFQVVRPNAFAMRLREDRVDVEVPLQADGAK
jgi:hypothetical protein